MGPAVKRTAVPHPAPYSAAVLEALGRWTEGLRPLLDPFAGTGRVHDLGGDTYGVEIEPEWAAMHPRTEVGDACDLRFPDGFFACVATSPTYGNRFADRHNARDGSLRRGYTHDLRKLTGDPDRQLAVTNTGRYQWGTAYQALHKLAWKEVGRVLRPGGRFVLNVSDHYRNGRIVDVCRWHEGTLRAFGFQLEAIELVPTPRLRLGANRHRVPHEEIQVWAAPVLRAGPPPRK